MLLVPTALVLTLVQKLSDSSVDVRIQDYDARHDLRLQTIYASYALRSKIDCCRICNDDTTCASFNYR